MPKLRKAEQVKTLRKISKWSAFRRNPNRFKLLKQSMGALARDPARITKSQRFGRGKRFKARNPKRFKMRQGRFE